MVVLTAGQIADDDDAFRCTIKPRDEKHEVLLRGEWEAAQVHLDADGNFTGEFFEKVFERKRK